MVCEQKKSMGIRLKDLSKLGYRDNVARSLVVDIVGKYCKHDTKEQIAMTLSNILEHPNLIKTMKYGVSWRNACRLLFLRKSS